MSQRAFRPGASLISVGVTALIAVIILVDGFVRVGVAGFALVGPVGLVALAICVPLGASALHVSDDGIRVINGAKTWDVPWVAVAGLRWEYQLRIDLVDGRTIVPWGGPEARRSRPLADRGGRMAPKGSELLDEFVQIRERALATGVSASNGSTKLPTVTWSRTLLSIGFVFAAATLASLLALLF